MCHEIFFVFQSLQIVFLKKKKSAGQRPTFLILALRRVSELFGVQGKRGLPAKLVPGQPCIQATQ